MLVVDLKQDSKGIKFSVAARIAVIIKGNKQATIKDLQGKDFTEDEILRHWDAAHFLNAIDNMSNIKGKRLWLRVIKRLWLKSLKPKM